MSATLHRLPVDPDLERAVVELAGTAVRLRQVEEDLIRHAADERYATYAHRIVLLNDARRAIAGRAEVLAVRPGSLLLFIEEHARLRKRTGRKPSLAQLQRAVGDALDVRQRDLSTRRAEQAMADFHARHAADEVDDGLDAIRYLEACAS
jgi:hypothetical protein